MDGLYIQYLVDRILGTVIRIFDKCILKKMANSWQISPHTLEES